MAVLKVILFVALVVGLDYVASGVSFWYFDWLFPLESGKDWLVFIVLFLPTSFILCLPATAYGYAFGIAKATNFMDTRSLIWGSWILLAIMVFQWVATALLWQSIDHGLSMKLNLTQSLISAITIIVFIYHARNIEQELSSY